MDDFFRQIGSLPRRHPSPLPVDIIGAHAAKKNWMARALRAYNFSFIFQGQGTLRSGQQEWTITSPCVFVQPCDVFLGYGPDQQWTELYITYASSTVEHLRHCGFADNSRLVWPIHNIAAVMSLCDELLELLQRAHLPGVVDKIDRLCELMILESFQEPETPTSTGPVDAVRSILAFVSLHFAEDIDFNELLAKHKLSPSTFRRYWATLINVPPAQYVQQLRIHRACSLLVQTGLPIGTIAGKVGFQDPLYFSRLFRQTIGITAREYRKNHRF